MAHVAVEEPRLGDNAAQVLAALMRIRNIRDAELGVRSGLGSRSVIQARRVGDKRLDLDDIGVLARALNVAPSVFLMDPIAAQRWVLDHAPLLDVPYDPREVHAQSSRWITARTSCVAVNAVRAAFGLAPLLPELAGDVVRLWPRLVPDDDGEPIEVPPPAPVGDELPTAA